METDRVTILIPTTPERKERLARCMESVKKHITVPYDIKVYENNYEGYVAAIHKLLEGVNGLVWCLNDDIVLENDALSILKRHFLERFPNRDGLVQPKDGIQEGNVATLPFCDAEVMRKYTHKGYFHNFADQEFTMIMKSLNKFLFVPEAIVTHEHWINVKAEKDFTYSNSQSYFEKDKEIFVNRAHNNFFQ